MAKTTKTTTKVTKSAGTTAKGYVHADKTMAARPEVGAAPRFRAKQPPASYRYDNSLSPALEWDTNPAREVAAFLMQAVEDAAALAPPHLFPERRRMTGADGKTLLEVAGLQDALAALKRMQAPFLNWAGKAERLSFEVPTMPLFVHERLSTAAIVKTLEDHRKRPDQEDMFGLFADPQRPLADQVRAFEHRDRWVNRMILGDSLVVMNSLLRFEGLGGQVQMIYVDPPYGVKFGSNFQPFVRKRDVTHGDDEDMTREPEMVQAYRDTWDLGLHSYLTYLRDRLAVAHALLASTGSVFVQISDQNLHHVRQILDDVFGSDNFISQISFQTTSGFETKTIATLGDFLLWYAKDKQKAVIGKLYREQPVVLGEGNARWILLPDGTYRGVTAAEKRGEVPLPAGARLYMPDNIQSQGAASEAQPFEYEGRVWLPNSGSHWKASYPTGMDRLAKADRIHVAANSLRYRRFHTDFGFQELGNIWTDTITGNFTEDKIYAVQTNTKVIERCILLASRPGDLVIDPTCGSGTTALMSEHWGRRWITIDTSRVPLALARQRLLTALYPYFRLMDEERGPASGFVYARRQGTRKEEKGGVVPHIKLETIANGEPPTERVLVDRPEEDDAITRVTGPFVVEATLPTPASLEELASEPNAPQDEPGDHITRMIEVLRRAPDLALPGNRRVTLKNIRRPGRSLSLSAEAVVDHDPKGGAVSLTDAIAAADETNRNALPFSTSPVAILFGPADGPITAKSVRDAADEAERKQYRHLFIIGFSITADARREVEAGEALYGLPITYVTATMDLQMGDLLKNQRSSQIFAVCGLPEVEVIPLKDAAEDGTPRWQVKLLGLDVFDPVTMTTDHAKGENVPMWMLDVDWNGMAFHADQVFFPKTAAWESLKKALKATHEEAVWDHLRGTTSAPFAAPLGTEVAVKVLDERGNELLVTRKLERVSGGAAQRETEAAAE